jgi:hypothetical protein
MLVGSTLMDSSICGFAVLSQSGDATPALPFADPLLASIRERRELWRGMIPPCLPPILLLV